MTSSSSNSHPPPATSSTDLPTQSSTSSSHLDPNAQLANSGYAPNDNQLAGLVEAATAAADQDISQWTAAAAVAAAAGAASHNHQLDGYGADMHLTDDGFGDANFGTGMASGRHLRVPGNNEHSQSPGLSRTVSKKRKRNDDNLDPALTSPGLGASQHAQSHSSQQNSQGYSGDGLDIRAVPPQSLSEARAVGVHSAAALFRQPSSNKKYTRPPMSKLFTSLELSPENFLHLQAAAKGYMLNDQHPERRDCVGQRGKGDTEMVKLRLWNCVRHFLEAEGNGERFFGENVINEGMGPRTYIWPRDQQKIISLVIPLLRRMVTNERQRQYAIETRKGGGSDDRRRRRTDEGFHNLDSPRFSPEQSLQMHTQAHRPDDLGQAMPPPPPPQQPMGSDQQTMDLGLTDLLLDGYPMDWNEITRSYDMYNQDFELDNLWSLSGLQQSDWRGLVAAIDSHYHTIHSGDYNCPPGCEDANIDRIIHANTTSALPWRIGGGRNLPARDEFASSITRDVSRIIRENIAARHGGAPPPRTADHQFHHPQQPFTADNSQNQTSLRVNILQHGKRILSRLDLLAGQYPSIDSVKQAILRRFPGQIPGLPFVPDSENLDPAAQEARESVAAAEWRVKVWLPDGLITVQNQKDWTIALLSAETVDWMDGDLKVLVEVDGASEQQ
ncbi:hypothetical protein NUU61_000288 [Penicillium alfredii]|uniref:Uncharacterized protein n=1 Tax=Penicillium alfredii TaxID=1506179 RepID=A0A9W9G9P9_9EURO|nr:uncharacterized protein NUU61_000288 [Penicillium alfredii]KAJ5114529.1 hypothetical protein NUU61_000288 [Penicillium alfredii]